MNYHQTRAPWLISAACGLMLAGSASLSFAQNTNPTNNFDTASSTASWKPWDGWGLQGWPMTWDSSLDAAGDANSGSLKYEVPFTGALGEQIMTFGTIANRWGWDGGYILDATTYTNMGFDIKVDPASAITPGGNYGSLELGLVTDGWGTTALTTYVIPLSATNWTHVDRPMTATLANIEKVVGYYFKMWSNGAHTNTLTFNIDNVMYTKPTAPVIIPPPTVSLSKAKAGLNLINTSSAGPNGRQNIHPVNPSYSWLGVANPVSFKITVKDYPAQPTGYQTHLFLAPESSLPYGAGDTALDWNCTNLVFVQIQNTTGGGQMTFMYKTNFGSGWGGQVFGSNSLGQVQSAVMNGTWTITFANDTNVTLTAPDNTTTNIVMPPDSAAMFAGSVYAWIGSQANGADKVGLSDIIERIEISGFPSDNVNDNFPGPGLDTNVWAISASDPAGVQVVPASTAYWLDWTVPDVGFSPQSSPLVGPGAVWSAVTSPRVLFNGSRHAQVSAPSSTSGYFRMRKPTFYQLQVLMPGETNAPGTLTGKIGTPDPQLVGSVIDVRVLAVSDDWYPITSVTDTIHFESNDLNAFVPADAALVSGAFSGQMFFGSAGNWTVTASDVSNTNILSNTSSPVNVQ